MSRFFATASDSESSSDDEPEPRCKPILKTIIIEEEAKRTVKAASVKRNEVLSSVIHQVKNYIKIKDFGSLLEAFESLMKLETKYAKPNLMPKLYMKCLVDLEDFTFEAWDNKDFRQAMPKSTSKALVALRQKLKRFTKKFSVDLNDFRSISHTISYENVSSDEELNVAIDKTDDKLIEEESTDFGESDSYSSDDEIDSRNLREHFLKKNQTYDSNDSKKERKGTEGIKKSCREIKDENCWKVVKGSTSVPLKPSVNFGIDEEVSVATVAKKLNEIESNKNIRRHAKKSQIELVNNILQLIEVHQLSKAVAIKAKLLLSRLIFDYNPNFFVAMKPEYWNLLLKMLYDLTNTLKCTEDVQICENFNENEESLEQAPFKVKGSLISLILRLDDEFVNLLKETAPTVATTEYVERLKDESNIITVIDNALTFLERQGVVLDICRIYLLKINHLYFKIDLAAFKEDTVPASILTMEKLCSFIYKHDNTDILRTRAILAQIYHKALHDHWTDARDLMLMSHLQENIHLSDVVTQISYNRAMAQLGLCAFRQGKFTEAHNCLVDLVGTGRMREVLGQGFQQFRNVERNREQILRERQLQLPYHMHIPTVLLECVYLICAMLIDVPYLAGNGSEGKRRMISKTFYQQLRMSERQCLVGPPENMREHIIAASKAMRAGRWRETRDLLINSKMKSKVWCFMQQPSSVTETLSMAIQREALKTYINTYTQAYDSIDLSTLAEMFDMSVPNIRLVISQMILSEELLGAINASDDILLVHNCKRKGLQVLANVLLDKLGFLLDSNEKMIDRPLRKMRAL